MFEGIYQVVAQPAFDFTPVIAQVFLAVATAVVGFVGVAARNFINANKNDKNWGLLTDIVEVGVQAAEQLYGRQNGAEKFDTALAYVEAELAKQGLKVDAKTIAAAIEAAVLREFNYPQAVEPATPPTETVVTMPGGDTSSGDES